MNLGRKRRRTLTTSDLAALVLSGFVEQAFATELLAGSTRWLGYLLK